MLKSKVDISTDGVTLNGGEITVLSSDKLDALEKQNNPLNARKGTHCVH